MSLPSRPKVVMPGRVAPGVMAKEVWEVPAASAASAAKASAEQAAQAAR